MTEETFLTTLSEARAGSTSALNELFERFYPRVQQMVHRRLARDLRPSRPWLFARFSTGDVVQDVFRGVLRDPSAFAGKTEEAFVGYLAMAVRNQIVDAIRFHEAERRDVRLSVAEAQGSESPADVPAPLRQAAIREQLDQFHTILASFPERERLLLRARLDGTETFEELAEQLGYSSESAARRAYYNVQARVSLLMQRGAPDG